MQVQWTETNYPGANVQRDMSVEDFTVEQVLYHENYHCDREKVCLEKQPDAIARAMGRLLDFLLEKKIMTVEEFHAVIGTDYHYRDVKIATDGA